MSRFRNVLEAVKQPIEKLGEKVRPFHALEKEAKLGPVLHAEVLAALKQLQQKHPEIKKVLQESAGYAVVPRSAERRSCSEAPTESARCS